MLMPYLLNQSKLWSIIQVILWIVGATIIFFLIASPAIGINLFWNILIPVAPALLVIAPGLWRNICPMSSTAMMPKRLKLSKGKKLTDTQSSILYLIAVISLYLIVPLRHTIFDNNGLATALMLISAGLIAISLSLIYESKSAWCSSLCPVHPVEKLYGGQNNKFSLPNAHCKSCQSCVTACPDSVSEIKPLAKKASNYRKFADLIMIGGFPGFIWGWFHVQNYAVIPDMIVILSTYKLPLFGFLVTMSLFLILRKYIEEKIVISYFAAAAVSCYYWFRIPALFGFGMFPDDGMLIDLASVIPAYYIDITVIFTTGFFFWWIVFSKQVKISWMVRPIKSYNV